MRFGASTKEKSDDDGECRFCVSTTLQRDTTTKKGKKRSSKEKEREKKNNRHFKTLNNTQVVKRKKIWKELFEQKFIIIVISTRKDARVVFQRH